MPATRANEFGHLAGVGISIQAAAQRRHEPLDVPGAAVPYDRRINRLIERRGTRDGRRQPPPRRVAPNEIDQDAIDDRQHIAGEAAASSIGADAMEIVLDQLETYFLIGVFARGIADIARQLLRHPAANIALEKPHEPAPGIVRRFAEAPGQPIAENVTGDQRKISREPRAPVETLQSGVAVGFERADDMKERSLPVGAVALQLRDDGP